MKIEIFQPQYIYEIGQRTNQEDYLWPLPEMATDRDRSFIVCDGMGGHEKGEVASQTVCTALGQWFKENVCPDEAFTDDKLREALEFAYQELDKMDDGSPRKMGTTLTFLYIHAKGVTAAHIGDSRIYHIRPQEGVLYQSRDHSLVYELYQSGEITFDEMATHPQKNIITRAMQPGEDNRVRPDIIHITDVKPGDYFYMCSDGMLEQMSNEELSSILSSDIPEEEKRNKLIDATIDNKDNHTAWIIKVKDVAQENGDEQLENEEPTARCNTMNIKPQITANYEEVETIKEPEDDVVMVSAPMTEEKKSSNFKHLIAASVILLLLLTCCLMFLFPDDAKVAPPPKQKPILLQKPIVRDSSEATNDTIKDINKSKNESARN